MKQERLCIKDRAALERKIAELAREAGFDGVDVKACHGSPLENRIRINKFDGGDEKWKR